ncbi:MAG: ATP-binding protein [Chloroflexota bacterium]
MTENIFLNWAIIAISLFNTILTIWLGLTVLLNAEQRNWGIWLASGSLLLGGAFFVSHTAVVGIGLLRLSLLGLIFWWVVGIVPMLSSPFAWYVIMLWYAGFWQHPDSQLRQRQRWWFWLTAVFLFAGLASAALGTLLLAIPVAQYATLRFLIRWSIAGIPILALGYATYVLLCITLSLDALRQPEPSGRMMGQEARARARPWLTLASIGLFVVSLLVAGFLLWLVQSGRDRPTVFHIYANNTFFIGLVDLIIASIIGAVIIFAGRAIVSYEVFTGKTLPRHGLSRHWRRILILATGYSILLGAAFTIQLNAIYTLLLTTLLITTFFALVSWRSYAERERIMRQLRPFTNPQNLTDQLLTQQPSAQITSAHVTPAQVDTAVPFAALCRDVLDAEVAYLVPLGSLAPLVGPPLSFPHRQQLTMPAMSNIIAQLESPDTMLVAVDPLTFGAAVWAIPLWSERGLIGTLLLGNKRGGSLYTQEEIEIARSTGERLIDTQASAEIGRRLMGLQRERLAQTQIIDQQTRRVLHDDILPTLQTALIELSAEGAANGGENGRSLHLLTDAHRQISDLLHNMPTVTAPDVARLGLVPALQRLIKNEFSRAFDEVKWQIEPAGAQRAANLPTLTAEVLFYAAREAIRNAAKYGRDEEKPFVLTLTIAERNGLVVEVHDNGIGLDATAHLQNGAGQGLALHSTMMAVAGGSLVVVERGAGTAVLFTLPTQTLSQ